MSNENLQQLQGEFASAIREALNDSKLMDLFEKYGLVDKNAVSIKFVVDTNYVNSSLNANTEPQIQFKSALGASSINELELTTCCLCSDGGFCCPCTCTN